MFTKEWLTKLTFCVNLPIYGCSKCSMNEVILRCLYESSQKSRSFGSYTVKESLIMNRFFMFVSGGRRLGTRNDKWPQRCFSY